MPHLFSGKDAPNQPSAPTFTPGSGWYMTAPMAAPGSLADIKGKLGAAFPCTVLRMRAFGMRLPVASLLQRGHPSGGLICQDQYTHPKWHAKLFELPQMKVELLPQLSDVALVRENAGVRLYKGTEYHLETRQHFAQTWLCTPTLQAGLAILEKMSK